MGFELVVVQGRSAASTLKIGEGVTTIGRHDDCQLRIKSSQVSRKHCELFEKKGHLLVKDLGSANGTIVNGKRIQGQRVLEPGDELTIGPIQFRVVQVGEAAPAKRAAAPGDTAVSEPVAVAEVDEDFAIDFEEPTQTTEAAGVAAPAAPASKPKPKPKPKAPGHDEDAIADFLMDLPIEGDEDETTTVTAPAAAGTPATPAPQDKGGAAPAAPAEERAIEEKEKEKEVEHPPGGAADDAIADFLLDIKIDDEE